MYAIYIIRAYKGGGGMTRLYIIFVLAMVVDAAVAYLCVEIVLSEFKGINLPLMRLWMKTNDEDKRHNKSVTLLGF